MHKYVSNMCPAKYISKDRKILSRQIQDAQRAKPIQNFEEREHRVHRGTTDAVVPQWSTLPNSYGMINLCTSSTDGISLC